MSPVREERTFSLNEYLVEQEMDTEHVNRREALRRTALLMGGLVFAPTAAGVLQGCSPSPDWTPEFFSADEARLVSALSEAIIPETDTPGAIEAGVPAFIEEMVTTAYAEEDRERFMDGLAAFGERAEADYGAPFVDLAEAEQTELAAEENRRAIEGESETEEGPPFFLVMKELVLTGFFTSETGATETLQHEAVPGSYDGCAPLEEVGRAWAE